MKRLAILFLALLYLAACSVAQKRNPSSWEGTGVQEKFKHVIFLVHGVGGDHTTFIKMDRALENQLSKLDPCTENRCVEYHSKQLMYSTENSTMDTTGFSKVIGKQIDQYFQELGGLGPNDKISFVTHSQGGIVSLIWLFHTFIKNNESKYRDLIQDPLDLEGLNPVYFGHVRNFITLGTPFWGSKMGPLGLWVKESCKSDGAFRKKVCEFTKNLTKLIGIKELKGVAFNSQTIYSFRQNSLIAAETEIAEIFRTRIRPLNIAGVAMNANWLLDLIGSGRTRLESDVAVSVPSARYDFIRAVISDKDYTDGAEVGPEAFTDTPFNVPLVLTNAFHSLLILPPKDLIQKPEEQLTKTEEAQLSHKNGRIFHDRYDLAQVGIECFKDIECDHRTFKTIVYHILGDEWSDYRQLPPKANKESNEILKQMTSFFIDLDILIDAKVSSMGDDDLQAQANAIPEPRISLSTNIALNPSTIPGRPANQAKRIYYEQDGKRKKPVHDKIVKMGGEYGGSYKKFVRGIKQDKQRISLRNYYMGSAIESYIPNADPSKPGTFKDRFVRMKIEIPGYKSRVVDVKVRPTYSTFLEVHLE